LKFEPQSVSPSHASTLRFLHDEIDRGGEAVPVGGFFFELEAAGGSEAVELGDAAGFGFGALALDPAFLLEAVERGIKRTLLDLQYVAGDLFDALGDGPAMLGFESNGLKDKEVKSALNEIAGFAHSVIIYTRDCR